MIELEHDLAEPAELSRYRSRYPAGTWEDPAFRSVRQIIRRQLSREQEGLCVYCERTLGANDGHVEHIVSRSSNYTLTFHYENLAHSCDGPRHCGHCKGNDVLPIEPRLGCNRFFSVLVLSGAVVPSRGLSADEARRSNDTIRILGLNAASLSWQRKRITETLVHLPKGEQAAFLATIPFRWILQGL